MASQPAGAAGAEVAASPFLAKPLSPVVKLSSGTFFEGVEKTLEIEFFPKASLENNNRANDACSLRRVPRERLEEVLGDIGCQILSTISNADCDAYVLSESSLFVFPTLLIIKTCGRTKVLAGLDAFLDIASGLGLRVDQVFYSRKNYLLPDEQAFPHSSLNTEIDFLRSRFPEGDAHIFGPVTGDHWTLFHYEAQHDEGGGDRVDHTLEVLMTGIRREVAAQFFKSPPTPDEDDGEVDDDYGGGDDDGEAEEAADDSTDADDPRTFGSVTSLFGFDSLFPDMTLDGHLFDPCGYSVNGLSNAGDGTYFTIHVTPEDDFSYASFETNVSIDDYRDLIRAVVSVFEPAQCLVVTYAECHAPGFVFKMHTSLVDSLDEYEARNLHTLDGDGYRVQVCRLLNLS